VDEGMKEIWKDIEGYSGYQVSSLGRIRSLGVKARVLKQFPNKNWPYLYVRFTPYNKTFRSHRLVAKAFIPNPYNLPEVNHLNGDKQDNRVDNLQWVSSSDNSLHSYRTGLHKPSYGNSRLTKEDVFEIRCLKYYGLNNVVLASEYGVTPTAIGDIVKWRTWKTA
jgi:hypothetical protein